MREERCLRGGDGSLSHGCGAGFGLSRHTMTQVIRDCDKAISLSPDFIKAYIRKSKALASMVREHKPWGLHLPSSSLPMMMMMMVQYV